MAAARRRRRAARRAVARAAAHPPRRGGHRALRRGSGRSPTCSTSTACAGRRCSRRGRAARTSTASAGASAGAAGRPSSGGGCATAIGVPSPAERLEAACARLRRRPRTGRRCRRGSALFGLTRLPASHLQVLQALAGGRDVHLFLLHPSPALWGRRAEARPRAVRPRADGHRRRGSRQPSAGLVGRRRAGAAAGGRRRRRARRSPPSGWTGDRCADTLLGAHAGRHPRRPPAAGRAAARREPTAAWSSTADDHSVAVHACHGRARQVEVLREAILHLPGRRPHARAAGRDRHVPGHRDVRAADPGHLRRRPASPRRGADGSARDGAERPICASGWPTARSARPTRSSAWSPSCSNWPSQRLTASQVLDLADAEPVRRRFRFDDDDLAQIQRLGRRERRSAGASTPSTAARRTSSTEVDAGTWAPGLHRLLLGVAMGEADQRAVRAACCRSTTSRAARSTSPGASPSSSIGSAPRSRARGARSRSRLGRRRWRPPPTR